MAEDTLQFLYKVGAIVMGIALLAILGAMIGGVFYFGDGEGINILNSMSAPFLSLLGAVVALLAPHQIASAVSRVRSTPSANSEPASSPAGQSASDAITGTGV